MKKHLGALFDLVYLGFMTNVLLVLACLPMVATLVTTDPARSWPLLALLSPLCAPAVCAACAVLTAYTSDRSSGVVVVFLHGWRASARRALTLGALAAVTLVVLGVDARAVWGRPVGAVALPVLVVAMTLVVTTTMLALVLISARPRVRLRDAARACLYLGVRRWYLTGFSLFVLAMFQALLTMRPALALGLAATPLLYVIWANSRFTLLTAGAVPGGRAVAGAAAVGGAVAGSRGAS